MAVKVGIGADISGFKQGTNEVRRDLADMAKSPDRMVKMGVDTREVDAALGKFGSTTAKVAVKADGVESAIASIQKLEDALVKTGQIGKSLGHIKFNTKASAEFNRSLLNIQENYRAINRTAFGKDVNRRLEATGQATDNPLNIDWLKAYSGDDVQADKAYRRYVGKLEHGAKFEPDAPPKWEKPAWKEVPPGGAPQPTQAPQPPRTGNLFGYLRQGVGFGLGLAGINSLGSLIGDAVSSETSTREAENLIFKRGSGYDDWGELDSAIGRLAKATMMTSTEVSRLSAEYVRAANATGDFAGDIEQEIQGAAQFGRGYGMDPRMSVEAFGRMAGVGFAADKSSQREFAGLLANTIAASGMSARGEQVMGDLAGQVQRIADSEGRVMSAGEMAGFAQTLASLYSNPALRGAGAGNVISGMNELTKGANATGQLMLWNAFAKTGGKGYIQFEHFKNADAFDQFEGKSKLDLLWPQIQRSANVLPGDVPEEQRLAFVMHEMVPAISMQMGEAIARARTDMERSGRSFGGFTQWATQATGKPIEDIAPGAWRDLTKLYKDSSSVNWRTEAERYLQNDTLTGGERDRLKNALEQFNGGQEGTLREILPQLMARAGMPQTEADRMIAADNELKDALRDLLSPLRDLKTTIEERLVPPINTVARILTEWLSPEEISKDEQTARDAHNERVGEALERGGITGHWDAYIENLKESYRKHGKNWDTVKDSKPGRIIRGTIENIEESAGWMLKKMVKPAHSSMHPQYYPGEGLQPDKDLGHTPFGRLIARGEGDYNSVNRGQAGGYRSGREDLESMTVEQVMSAQRERRFNAAGRYQITRETMRDAVKSLGLSGNEKFDRTTQDRIFSEYLAGSRRPAIRDFLSGKSDDIRSAVKQAAMEWASVANPDTGRSHYHGRGRNRASITAAEMADALRRTRAQLARHKDQPAPQTKATENLGKAFDPSNDWQVESIANRKPGSLGHDDDMRQVEISGSAGKPWPIAPEGSRDSGKLLTQRITPDEDKPVVPATPRIAVPDEDKPAIPSTPPLAFKSDLNRNMGELASVIPKADMPKLPEIEAPKTPHKLETLTQANTIQQPANARLQGQVDVNMTLVNDRGDVLHQRNGVLVSEPSLHGSHGSTGYTNRLVYADSSAQR